jgi:hypothetical protein
MRASSLVVGAEQRSANSLAYSYVWYLLCRVWIDGLFVPTAPNIPSSACVISSFGSLEHASLLPWCASLLPVVSALHVQSAVECVPH